jgi:hypothetical protein
MESPCSLCLCIPISTFGYLNQSSWNLVCTYIMAPEPISMAYFINPTHQSVCLYVYPPIIARQQLSRNITAAMNTHATINELLDASLSISKESRRLILTRTSCLSCELYLINIYALAHWFGFAFCITHTWLLLGLSDHLFPVFVNLKLLLMVWEVLGFFQIPEAHGSCFFPFSCTLTSK